MAPLTDEDKREIGQHFVLGFYGHDISEGAKILIRDYHVGHIILMKRNVQSVKQVHTLVRNLQQFARDSGHSQPLMIGIDQENGLVSAFSSNAFPTAGTQFPGAMALAATNSEQIAEDCAAASAKEMKLAGINWVYSPVADVNSDHRNPVIGVRSFGDDPREVARFAKAVSRGLTKEGIAPSAKHFPGHGDTHVDSHLALPEINKSERDLFSTELVPFSTLVNDNIATIMTGHMALPQVTQDNLPSSLSKKITVDLLRTKMGFKGVVVTDCLEMDAVAAKYTTQKGAVRCLQAGADIVMICHTMNWQRDAIEETYKSIESGDLSLDQLRESGRRIVNLKASFAGTWDDALKDLDEGAVAAVTTANQQLSAKSYAASTALVRGPLPDWEKVVGPVLVMTPEIESLNKAVDDAEGVLRFNNGQERNTAGPYYIAFAASVSARRKDSQHFVYSRVPGDVPADVVSALSTAAAVIFVTRNADRSSWQLEYLRKLKMQTALPVIIVGSCAPYDLMEAPDILDPYVASFEYTPAALEAAASVIFRERAAKGRVPVLKGDVVAK